MVIEEVEVEFLRDEFSMGYLTRYISVGGQVVSWLFEPQKVLMGDMGYVYLGAGWEGEVPVIQVKVEGGNHTLYGCTTDSRVVDLWRGMRYVKPPVD